jgi:hypothetical protein
MRSKKILKEEKSTMENSYNDLLNIYNRYYGEYKPQKSQDEPVSKETEMGEGKLFTNLIMKK